MEKKLKTYLFSYRYSGRTYCFDVVAYSLEEAKARAAAMKFATYDGVLAARIPAKLGFIARCFVYFGNLFETIKRAF